MVIRDSSELILREVTSDIAEVIRSYNNNNNNLFNHVIVSEHKCSFKIGTCIKSTIITNLNI